LNIINILVPL